MAEQLTIPNFSKGLILNVASHQVPEGGFVLARNLSLFKGELGVTPGYRQFIQGLAALSGTAILNIDEFPMESGVTHLLVMTTNKIYRWDNGVTFVDISGAAYGATLDDAWNAAMVVNPAGDLLFVCCSHTSDPVQKWDGNVAGTFVDLVGHPTNAGGKHFSAAVAEYQNHLMHLHVTEGGTHFPRKLRWSDNGLPESYTGGESGFLTLFQGADWGLLMEPLSVYMAAYRERSIHLINFVGSPFFMSQRQVVNGIGLLAPRALLNLDSRHVFLGNDNVYLFNGIDLEPIGQVIHDDLFSRIDPANAHRSLIMFDEARAEMWLIVPTAQSDGVPDTWWSWNLDSGVWAGPIEGRPITGGGPFQRRLQSSWDSLVGNTWDSMSGSWERSHLIQDFPVNLFGNATMKVYTIDPSIVTADGVVVTGRLETGSVYAGEKLFKPPVREATCVGIVPLQSEAGKTGMNWFVGVSDSPTGPFTYTGPYQIGVRGIVYVKPTTGKWFQFACEVSSQGKLSGLVGLFEPAG